MEKSDCNCRECNNFKFEGEGETHHHKKFAYGICELTGEYKTDLTPCTYEYKNSKRWCHDESIQLDQSIFCRIYHYDCDKCFNKEFWEEIVDENEKDKHFVNIENFMEYPNIHQIYFICEPGQKGGFGNSRFYVELDNGEFLENRGLWGNGFSPNKEIIDKLMKGKFIR